MVKLGSIVRFLALVLCLVPFTNSQQARGAIAPFLPVVLMPTGDQSPGTTREEEERGEREEVNGKQRHSFQSRAPLPMCELAAALTPLRAPPRPHLTRPLTAPPAAADPFRNGLGTPYRC